MLGDTIYKLRNRVFEQPIAFGKNLPNAMTTNANAIYRVTGFGQIADIINTGYVRCKEGKVNGGHELELFWTHGGEKLFFYSGTPVLETSTQKLRDNQIGALTISDLTHIWIFNEQTQQYENLLPIILMIGQICIRNNFYITKEGMEYILTNPLITKIQELKDMNALNILLFQFPEKHFNKHK